MIAGNLRICYTGNMRFSCSDCHYGWLIEKRVEDRLVDAFPGAPAAVTFRQLAWAMIKEPPTGPAHGIESFIQRLLKSNSLHTEHLSRA